MSEPSNWNKWAEAFTIFASYKGSEYEDVSAEHDEVYAGPNPEKVSGRDKLRLEQLGWSECEEHLCFHKFT